MFYKTTATTRRRNSEIWGKEICGETIDALSVDNGTDAILLVYRVTNVMLLLK